MFVEFHTVKKCLVSKGDIFYTILLQIHSGNCLQKLAY